MANLSSDLFDLVDHIVAATTAAEVWSAYLGAAKNVGLLYRAAYFVPPSPEDTLHTVTESLPDGWRSEYDSAGLNAGDLLAERARKKNKSFDWRMSDWDYALLSPIQKL